MPSGGILGDSLGDGIDFRGERGLRSQPAGFLDGGVGVQWKRSGHKEIMEFRELIGGSPPKSEGEAGESAGIGVVLGIGGQVGVAGSIQRGVQNQNGIRSRRGLEQSFQITVLRPAGGAGERSGTKILTGG